jgi:putative transcriptional regulator
MEIIVRLDEMMARRKMRLQELAQKVGITEANLSILKNDKAKAIRFSTLAALCKVLNCQPGELLEFVDFQPTVAATSAEVQSSAPAHERSSCVTNICMLISCIILTYSSCMTASMQTSLTFRAHKPSYAYQININQSICSSKLYQLIHWVNDALFVTRKRVDHER